MQALEAAEFETLIGLEDFSCALGVGDFASGNVAFLSTYPGDFQELYFKENWATKDPVIRNCANRNTEFHWITPSAANDQVMTTAADFGLSTGMSVSSVIGGNSCIMSLASDRRLKPSAKAHVRKELSKLHAKHLAKNAHKLSKTQIDLVTMFAHGMRAKEVADIYGISEEGIKLRKLRIQKTMGVTNFMTVVHLCALEGVTHSL